MEKIVLIVVTILKMLATQLKKVNPAYGIKELMDVVKVTHKISLILIKLLKDGLQASDAIEFYDKIVKNDEMKSLIAEAYNNYKLIPDEIKDIDMGEACELVAFNVEQVPLYIEAFKKEV
jgi:hypothetical protein